MKKEYNFVFLQEQDLPDLHQTFLKAFADYLIPIQLSSEQFKAKVKREGVLPSFCVAAYNGEEMVGFIMTGLGEWHGQPTAYNAGTGVIPAHRGKQLTKRLYEFLIIKLKESGVTHCLLEVIQENEPAFEVYRRIGFEITRAVDSYRANKNDLIFSAPLLDEVIITSAEKPIWEAYSNFCSYAPTWQNTTVAYKQFPDKKLVLEARTTDDELVGFIAFLLGNGAILQFAVHPEFRQQGIGTALLREVCGKTESPAIMLINVDKSATEFLNFLIRRHFKRFLGQYEMLMRLE